VFAETPIGEKAKFPVKGKLIGNRTLVLNEAILEVARLQKEGRLFGLAIFCTCAERMSSCYNRL